MPLFTRGDQRIAFIHVPKTGGTSVERYFESHGWTMSYWSTPRNGGRTPSDQHLLYDDLREIVPDLDDIPSFAIVRHPIRRFVSEWKWQRWEMRQISDDLTSFTSRVETSLANDPVYWDNHWRPQSDFLSDKIDRVIRLEDIESEFPKLLEMLELDLPPELPRSNSSSGRGLRAWLGRPRRATLDDRDIERLERIYDIDFHLLGYDRVTN